MTDSIAITTDLANRPASPLTKAQARKLTEKTKKAADDFWRLLVQCHEDKAWAALGYASWKHYVEAEMAMSESNAFRLLDQGKVTLALEAALDSRVCQSSDSRARESSPAKPAGQRPITSPGRDQNNAPLVTARQAAKFKDDLDAAVQEIVKDVRSGASVSHAVCAAATRRTPEPIPATATPIPKGDPMPTPVPAEALGRHCPTCRCSASRPSTSTARPVSRKTNPKDCKHPANFRIGTFCGACDSDVKKK